MSQAPSPASPPGSPRWSRRALLLPFGLLGLGLLFARAPEAPAVADGSLAKAAALIEAGRSHAWLSELQADYPERSRGKPAHEAAPAFIASSLLAVGCVDVRLESAGPGWGVNVLARVPGRDPSRAVLLGAHHDVVPGAPGAIDDGGGIAVLIEAARVLGEVQPACDVELAIYDGEEYGDIGSKAHARALGPEGRARVRAMLAVELVGWERDQLVVQTIPYGFAWDGPGITPSWLPQSLRAAAGEAGVGVGLGDPIVSPWYQGTVRVLGVNTGSDAGAFHEQGVPAAMLTGSALTNFYAGYHRPEDGMALVDADRLDDAAKVVAVAALALASQPPERTPRTQGDAYLCLGLATLDRVWLTLLGLAAVLPLGLAVWEDRTRRARAGVLAACAGLTGGLALAGSVVGVLVGGPLCCGLALAAGVQRGWRSRLALYLALGPLLIECLLLAAAGSAFGFRWRGGALETPLLIGLVLAACAAALLVQRARPPAILTDESEAS
jgi:Peptidase family M28